MLLQLEQQERLEALQERLLAEMLEQGDAAVLDGVAIRELAAKLQVLEGIDRLIASAYREPDEDEGFEEEEDEDEDDGYEEPPDEDAAVRDALSRRALTDPG